MPDVSLPTYRTMMNPTLQALRDLGGSAAIDELYNKVVEIMQLSDDQLEVIHDPDRSSQTEVDYRLAWTRTYLKKYGLIENSSRGVWALTPTGRTTGRVDPGLVSRFVRSFKKTEAPSKESGSLDDLDTGWSDHILSVLLKMEPDAFERLIQRVLRESGFIQVQVTGRSGDGGIDGNGIMRLGGLLSFHVIFQCKRYRGSVSAGQVRDFRGAMVGRADKGLLVTTGNFTKDALREATRDGAPAIDLIDGELLAQKLKELGIGVRTEVVQVERVTVDEDWLLGL